MIIAAIDPGFIIYLFFIVVWAVARLVQQGKKKKQRDDAKTRPQNPRQRPVIHDDFREILETLTGHKLDIPQPPPPPVYASAPPPPAPAQHGKRKSSRERPQREIPPPQRAPAYAQIESRPDEIHTIAGVSSQPRHSTTMSTASMLSAGTTMRSSIIGSSKHMTPPDWAPDLKHRHALRTAILNQVILGPPKALER